MNDDWFSITFPRPQKQIEKKYTPKTNKKNRLKTTEKILKAISENSSITMRELSKKLGVSYHTVDWNIRKMRQSVKIKRIGPDKGGYWEILKE